jgi:magnesium transporter
MSKDIASNKLNVRVVKQGDFMWVDVRRPGTAEMTYLRDQYGFHQLALDDCVSTIQIPKLDVFEDYLFLVSQFPVVNAKPQITLGSEVDIFAGADYLVTIHSGTLRPLTKLFDDCENSQELRERVLASSSGLLLYRIFDGLVGYCFSILNRIISDLNAIEKKLFETRERGVVREMALVRRDIISYRHVIRPMLDVLRELEEKEFPLLHVEPDIYFGNLVDHLRRILGELEDMKEVIESLHDTYVSVATDRNNDIIRRLTGAATLVLPFLALASIYGMNVPLPLEDKVWLSPILVSAASLLSVIMFVVLRVRSGYKSWRGLL